MNSHQHSKTTHDHTSWQQELANLITDPEILFTLLNLDRSLLPEAYKAVQLFPLKVTHSYLARIENGNLEDPLLKQILPLRLELNQNSGYCHDPLQETQTNPLPGLLHKYPGRVLITLTSACAIHCRYCFRRHFPYSQNLANRQGLNKIFDYLANDTSIQEVILSGGDPLAVNDHTLHYVSDHLNLISHIKRLRIHTRLPIVLPKRITKELIDWIKNVHQSLIMVVHVNHPQEINSEVKSALQLLNESNVTLLNQSVLLKGINDEVNVLSKLSEELFAAKVLPYYLHILDKITGAAHFDVDINEARRLHQLLCETLPGYLVPRLVQEEAGKSSKTLILPMG